MQRMPHGFDGGCCGPRTGHPSARRVPEASRTHFTSVLSLKYAYKIEQLIRGFGQRFWSR